MKREEVARKSKKAKNQQKLERRLAIAKAEANDPAAKKASTDYAITLVYLPNGPTAYFKLTSIELTKNIFGHARATPHNPELVLNGFVTRLGHAVGRMFQTMFPPLPEFQGRQVVTLHNQRDFLFFRRHRYAFRSTEKVALQEIGPRFTLKLRSLRKGLPAVLNYGEAPKPLEFDVGPFEETEVKAGQGSATNDDAEPNDAKHRAPVVPPKTDDYLWQWKASALHFYTFKLLLTMITSPNWRRAVERSSSSWTFWLLFSRFLSCQVYLVRSRSIRGLLFASFWDPV
ncbi:Ribosome production factor 1 [Termitomyces sp. J132]|nr:Ribosome production factor 1 [Termitomyces sp. J132]